MNAFSFSLPGDWLLIWGANVHLQVTLVITISLAIAAFAHRRPAANAAGG